MSGIAMSAILSGNAGAVTELDTETVTVGSNFDGTGLTYGYFAPTGTGSTANGTFAPKSASITGLYYYETISASKTVFFILSGIHDNDDWTTMTVNGVAFERSLATFSNLGDTVWAWPVASNPFGTSGEKEVVFI